MVLAVQPYAHIVYCDYAREMVCSLVHLHLKDIFRPKCISRNLYLPQWVLNMVKYEDFSLSWMLQKPSLLKHVAPLRQ